MGSDSYLRNVADIWGLTGNNFPGQDLTITGIYIYIIRISCHKPLLAKGGIDPCTYKKGKTLQRKTWGALAYYKPGSLN